MFTRTEITKSYFMLAQYTVCCAICNVQQKLVRRKVKTASNFYESLASKGAKIFVNCSRKPQLTMEWKYVSDQTHFR